MMKKLLAVVVFVLIYLFIPVLAAEPELTLEEKGFLREHPQITVNNDSDWVPYNFYRKGKAQGYTLDYMRLLGEKLGVEFKFISGPTWYEFINMLQQHKLDLIANFARTRRREDFALFTKPIIKYIPTVIVQRNASYTGLHDLAGKTVVVVKGYWYENAIKRDYPDIKVITVENNEDAIKYVAFGKADATVGNSMVLQYLWLENNLSNLKIAGEARLIALDQYFEGIGVRRDWPLLCSALNKAIGSVTFKEELVLKKKWFINDPSVTTKVILSEEEENFIKKHPVIRVHNEQNWRPFNFYAEGKAQGYTIDLINILAKKIGVKVEYISGPDWNEFVTMLKNHELDVIGNMVQLPEREKYAEFTTPLLTEYPSIVSHIHNPISSIKELRGKTVAVGRGSWHQEILEKNYPDINLCFTDTALDNLKAVAFGKADATLGSGPVVQHLIFDNNLSTVTVSGEAVLKSDIDPRSRMGIRKDWPLLRSAFDKAIASLTYKEIYELKDKWCAVDDSMVDKVKLSAQEEKFIAEHQVIRVHNELNWPPFNFNEDNTPKGYSIDYMNLIARKAGFFVEYVSGPTWDEFMGMIKNRELDVMLNIAQTPDRDKFIRFTTPYVTNLNVIISTKDAKITSLDDLKGKTVAVPKGFFYEEVLKRGYPEINLLLVDGAIDALNAVVYKKAYAAIDELAVADYLIEKHMYSNLKMFEGGVINNGEIRNLRIGVRDDWPLLQGIINKAIDKIAGDEVMRLKRKWLNFKNELNSPRVNLTLEEEKYLRNKGVIVMCVNPDNMPYDGIDKSGRHTGLAADFVNEFRKALPLPIKLRVTGSWEESLEAIAEGKCDIIPLISESPELMKSMNFTKSYYADSVAIVAQNDVIYLDSLNSLSNKKLALLKDDPRLSEIIKNYPQIEVVIVESMKEALRKVSEGGVFATLGSFLTVTRDIQKYGFDNIKIAGRTRFDNNFKIGVNKEDALLLAVLNKVVDSIDEKTRNVITQHWYTVNIQHSYNWRLIWRISGVLILLLCLLIYIIFSTRRYNKRLSEANGILVVRNGELNELKDELEEKNVELGRLAITDKLTGLYNRTKLDRALKDELRRFSRFEHEFGVVILDIDYFKRVNDRFGHIVGDKVLVQISHILQECMRSTDVIGRWGGEEFLLICPETDLISVINMAERVRATLEKYQFSYAGSITASFGVAMVNSADTAETLVCRADNGLYEAKNLGRNRVCVG